ncbi:hypothetical protein BVC80_1543g190 [Macleaya cordata]|uniref:3'-5' exonuclease domain n=1 Tax=Macleaya cordata TaxID=56857 RepID=A0A200R1Z3_MACCD|nr:hypothetical protein BVC80_1543g190 [Macleaya cordata]
MASSNQEIKFEDLRYTTSVADSCALVDNFLNQQLCSSLSINNTNIGKPVVGLAVIHIASVDKVALLQLCLNDSRCIIIQLLHLDSIPQSLKTFLADPNICFVSVGMDDVVAKLRRDFGIECGVSWRNLRPLDDIDFTRELLARFPNRKELVNVLINTFSELSIRKPKLESCSDWTVRSLSMPQIKVASMFPYLYFLVGSHFF